MDFDPHGFQSPSILIPPDFNSQGNPKVIWTHFTKLGFSCELKSSGIKIEESKSTNINTTSLKNLPNWNFK